eukprot:CAMPEP_0118904126 /NCGR_PEP_ID=MMETSP1166-20130328/8726_1 /TAXON_ID=1104430 /ORGANISM="Chrysoreinhardia sp, Strain CCMP3193" /LENGTH=342 /DNA_ID=CAMNT_0006843375 /DNA_START=49 /DNA_END=1075 /DNA_ORIENTATION=+
MKFKALYRDVAAQNKRQTPPVRRADLPRQELDLNDQPPARTSTHVSTRAGSRNNHSNCIKASRAATVHSSIRKICRPTTVNVNTSTACVNGGTTTNANTSSSTQASTVVAPRVVTSTPNFDAAASTVSTPTFAVTVGGTKQQPPPPTPLADTPPSPRESHLSLHPGATAVDTHSVTAELRRTSPPSRKIPQEPSADRRPGRPRAPPTVGHRPSPPSIASTVLFQTFPASPSEAPSRHGVPPPPTGRPPLLGPRRSIPAEAPLGGTTRPTVVAPPPFAGTGPLAPPPSSAVVVEDTLPPPSARRSLLRTAAASPPSVRISDRSTATLLPTAPGARPSNNDFLV